MWIPETTEELEAAIVDGTLPHESASFEVKAQLPESRKNSDIAIDVAAMSTDGGVIIYGVAEDWARATYSAHPIDLAGVNDRISNVVTTSVHESVPLDIRLLRLPSTPSRGYVVVAVPASIRAPHMVEVKDEYRYYGRVPGGNKRLSEAEVARLYERREQSNQDAARALDKAIELAPLSPAPGSRADLHLVARPLLSDRSLRSRVMNDRDVAALAGMVVAVTNELRFQVPWDPNLSDVVMGGYQRPTIGGVELFNPPIVRGEEQVDRYVSRLEILDDLTFRYFRASVGESEGTGLPLALRDPAIAQITARFVLMVGRQLEKAQYHGVVDIWIGVTGLEGAVSRESLAGFPPPGPRASVSADVFRNNVRVLDSELTSEPCDIAHQLVDPLLRVTRPAGLPDPLALE